jgi:hypothetical protein
MCTASPLVHADVAEAPVAFVADVAAPVTFIGPRLTACAEGAALKSVVWVVCCECFAAISATRSTFRR